MSQAAQRTRTQTDGAITTTTTTTTATSCSFVEIYNEKVYDLLGAEAAANDGANGGAFGGGGGGGGAGPGLALKHDAKGRVVVEGLDEVRVASAADALRVLTDATCRRRVRATAMNDVSR